MIYLLTIAIQVLCVIDVIRGGRNQLWIMTLALYVDLVTLVAGDVPLGDGAAGGIAR